MYTFQPVHDQYWNVHVGFYITVAISLCIMCVVLALWKNDEIRPSTVAGWALVLGAISYFVCGESYRPEVVYTNTKVLGTFVKFQPEGWNEQHGKTRADVHYIYVVYEVEGQYAIFLANPAFTYPKTAIMYKN
jgi:hypothetical protein